MTTATRLGSVTVEGAYVAGGEGLVRSSSGMHRGWVCLLGKLLAGGVSGGRHLAFALSGAGGLLSLGGLGALVGA